MTAPNQKRDITLTAIVVASRDQVSSDLAGETVLLSMTSARYYGLEGVGSRVWELVQEPIAVAEVRDIIAREYEVSADRCEADLLHFFRELADNALIEVRGGA